MALKQQPKIVMERSELDATVLIATRNRVRLLQQTLDSLSKQATDGLAWEVIVVDNGSQDGTAELLERMQANLPLVTLFESRPGKNRALNKALDLVRGRLLIFTDDDIVADPTWIRTLVEASHRWTTRTILAGSITPLFEDDVPAWLRVPEFAYRRLVFVVFWPQDHEGPMERRAFGPNFAVNREGIEGIRFCETIGPVGNTTSPMGSETEFLKRLEHDSGFESVFIPTAHVYHVIPGDHVKFRKLMKRAFRAGRGDLALGQSVTSSRFAGAPVYLWRNLIGAMLRVVRALPSGRLACLESLMNFSRVAGKIYQSRRSYLTSHQKTKIYFESFKG